MAELKTRAHDASVMDFLKSLADARQAEDCFQLKKMMEDVCQAPARMWGDAIVGFGLVKLQVASGRQVEWMRMGFSPRKGKLSLYLPGYLEAYASLLDELGPHGTGKGCLYIKRLSEVDEIVLRKILDQAASSQVL